MMRHFNLATSVDGRLSGLTYVMNSVLFSASAIRVAFASHFSLYIVSSYIYRLLVCQMRGRRRPDEI